MHLFLCDQDGLYGVSKALARHLELPLMLNASMAPPLIRQAEKDPMSHKSDNVPPELALVATVVIALKLVYSFDGKYMCAPYVFSRRPLCGY